MLIMANSSYTFSQVVNGTGYFNQAQDTGFSQGVKDLQTYLKSIGFTITDASGRFQSTTKTAVEDFQYQMGITVDGDAGPGTCKRLNIVRNSIYFNKYGKPLTNAQWGTANIRAGKFNDIDLLARIILAESGYTNWQDQNGVALVIKNRSKTPGYYASGSASIWARVVGMVDPDGIAMYDSAIAGNEIAQSPRRGWAGEEADGFIDPGWRHAVEVAEKLTKDVRFTAMGWLVEGLTITTKQVLVSNQLNQGPWSAYRNYYNKGMIKDDVEAVAFMKKTDAAGNVVFTI